MSRLFRILKRYLIIISGLLPTILVYNIMGRSEFANELSALVFLVWVGYWIIKFGGIWGLFE